MANLAEAANIYQHALFLLHEAGYAFAHIPGRHDREMRFVARAGGGRTVLHAPWPPGLLGVAHLVAQGSGAFAGPNPDTPWCDDLAGDDPDEVLIEAEHGVHTCASIRARCLREVERKGYMIAYYEDGAWWSGYRCEGERVEVDAFTPESLLGCILIYEHFGEDCWERRDFPDFWSDVPGEGWEDEAS